MWICPKCGREFKRTNQGHYCGQAPATVEEYIEGQALEIRPRLAEIRKAILSSVPELREGVAWSMPTYKKAGNSVSFTACKKHISLYVGAAAIERFQSEFDGITVNKNAVYFPYDTALPSELVREMVRWCFG